MRVTVSIILLYSYSKLFEGNTVRNIKEKIHVFVLEVKS